MKERVIKAIFDEEMVWKSCQIFVHGMENDPYLNMVYDRDTVSLYEDVLMVATNNCILMIDPSDVLMINVYNYTVEELTKQIITPIKDEESK